MKIRKRVCDFCGRDMEHGGDLTIFRRWKRWDESRWARCDVCSKCADRIRSYCERERLAEESGIRIRRTEV